MCPTKLSVSGIKNPIANYWSFFLWFSLTKYNRRRMSSITIMTPDIDGNTVDSLSEPNGFYMLKKDSQRRYTLNWLLGQDQHMLCETWLQRIRTLNVGEVVLENGHLEMLIKCLQQYIMNQDKSAIEQTILDLRKQLNFDSVAMRQLHCSLYLFQDAVRLVFIDIPVVYRSTWSTWFYLMAGLAAKLLSSLITGTTQHRFVCHFIWHIRVRLIFVVLRETNLRLFSVHNKKWPGWKPVFVDDGHVTPNRFTRFPIRTKNLKKNYLNSKIVTRRLALAFMNTIYLKHNTRRKFSLHTSVLLYKMMRQVVAITGKYPIFKSP